MDDAVDFVEPFALIVRFFFSFGVFEVVGYDGDRTLPVIRFPGLCINRCRLTSSGFQRSFCIFEEGKSVVFSPEVSE